MGGAGVEGDAAHSSWLPQKAFLSRGPNGESRLGPQLPLGVNLGKPLFSQSLDFLKRRKDGPTL